MSDRHPENGFRCEAKYCVAVAVVDVAAVVVAVAVVVEGFSPS